MIFNRKEKSKNAKSILEISRKVLKGTPFSTEIPLRVEISYEEAKISRYGDKIHHRNLGDQSYTVFENDPVKVLEVLAYEAHEWQAVEILKELRKEKKKLKDN